MTALRDLLMAALLLALGASVAAAQGYPVVGAWSGQTTNTRGEVTGTIFTTFRPDGRFVQRWVVPRATVEYSGEYRLAANGAAVQWLYRDYAPKQDCRMGACYPVMPAVQMNTPIVTQIRWVRANLFITEDGGGAVRWIRQP